MRSWSPTWAGNIVKESNVAVDNLPFLENCPIKTVHLVRGFSVAPFDYRSVNLFISYCYTYTLIILIEPYKTIFNYHSTIEQPDFYSNPWLKKRRIKSSPRIACHSVPTACASPSPLAKESFETVPKNSKVILVDLPIKMVTFHSYVNYVNVFQRVYNPLYP